MIHELPKADAFERHLPVSTPEETAALASRTAATLKGGEIILLWGDLGVGKTFFVQSLCEALGVTEDVTSPTFTLVNGYNGRLRVHHLDFYRLREGDDLADVGVDAILEDVESGSAILLVEWPGPILSQLDDRVELLATHGEGAMDRIWSVRGTPGLPSAWRDLFPSGDDHA
jgi:tRNA threonylcarbamoyladenosine biosynthesis protein TsaE